MSKNAKKALTLLGIAAAVFGLVFGIAAFINNSGGYSGSATEKKALQTLDKLYKNITVRTPTPVEGYVDLAGMGNSGETLPEIAKYPSVVEKSTELFVEIFSSPEKAGSGTDGWLTEAALAFNRSGAEVNGKPVSVRLRSISSGLGVDYIAAGQYMPDAFTPSNELWGEILKSKGVELTLIEKRMVGNAAGVLFSSAKQKELAEKYGAVNLKNIALAVRGGEIAMGYTNPFVSSTGLNYLLSTLLTFDAKNPLSDSAVKAFTDFSANVPFVAYTTLQMRDAAASGALDGFVLEYQLYANMPELQERYSFTPFGVRHDSPLYAIGKISDEKNQVLQQFNEFCKQDKWRALATNYGFNQQENYKFELDEPNGSVIAQAQQLWKKKKNSEQPITAVFLADISDSMGSMNNKPLDDLKKSLINGINYIEPENAIGLVTFSNEVNIALPIGKSDINQRSLMIGTVENLRAGGGTSMYEAIVVGMKMLTDAKAKNPDTKLMMFVLTDGESTGTLNFDDTKAMIAGLKVPIFTIGYHGNFDVLQQLADLNGAAYINADGDDVMYQLASLFNAQM
ncbi:MAG: VWA domain-containing protein [Oscillospiraceae bacterium]|nr:VWA domain-containing protein [Oscillospiraceae bacterium]